VLPKYHYQLSIVLEMMAAEMEMEHKSVGEEDANAGNGKGKGKGKKAAAAAAAAATAQASLSFEVRDSLDHLFEATQAIGTMDEDIFVLGPEALGKLITVHLTLEVYPLSHPLCMR
jgi:hypothetical protein